jgi:putative DNA primase/helicase
MTMTYTPLQERARGRWLTILPALGIDRRFLNRKNGPCPMCGGKDRWRFTDIDGKGTWWCNNCHGGAGVDLAIKFTGLPFKEAAVRIEHIIGDAPIETTRAEQSKEDKRAALNLLWQSGRAICADDPVDRWLQARSVGMQDYPKCLRAGMRVRHSGPPVTYHPAMLAMVTDASGKPATIHRTYITADGKKAPVDKVRMFCAGGVPPGGAVRLAPEAPVLGVAEGIETALAAMQMFGIPTWAALSDSGVEKFDPPAETQRLVIFGDNDPHFAGQRAAYGLAARVARTLEVEVRIPEKSGADWNDTLVEKRCPR